MWNHPFGFLEIVSTTYLGIDSYESQPVQPRCQRIFFRRTEDFNIPMYCANSCSQVIVVVFIEFCLRFMFALGIFFFFIQTNANTQDRVNDWKNRSHLSDKSRIDMSVVVFTFFIYLQLLVYHDLCGLPTKYRSINKTKSWSTFFLIMIACMYSRLVITSHFFSSALINM